MRLLVIRESNVSSRWHVVDIDLDDIESKWPLKPLFIGVSRNVAERYARKKRCTVFVCKDATVSHEDRRGTVVNNEDGTAYVTLVKAGGRGVKLDEGRYNVVSRPITLVDWDVVEAAEKRATYELSKGGKKPALSEVHALTLAILDDLRGGPL